MSYINSKLKQDIEESKTTNKLYSLLIARINRFQEMGIFIALLSLCIILSFSSSHFLKLENLLNVLRQISVVGIIAVGEALVIITGGIDLSVGSILALGGVCTALLAQTGLNPWIALIVGLVVGGIVGLINGLIVVKGRINPFITTLGMLSIARGVAYLFTQGMPINFENPVNFIGSGYILGIPVSVIIMFFVIIVGHIFVTKTVFGRNIFAVGDNEKAAKLSGIRVENVKMFVYSLVGVLSALAGIITAANLAVADTAAGKGLEMDVIAAVVIGGASLSGGQGSIIGVLIGAAIMGVLRNGFILLGISAYWQIVSIGIVIILAVGIDQIRKRD